MAFETFATIVQDVECVVWEKFENERCGTKIYCWKVKCFEKETLDVKGRSATFWCTFYWIVKWI